MIVRQVLEAYETHGYAIDFVLWREIVHGIWVEKVNKNVLFLEPLAQAKHATIMAGGRSDIEYVNKRARAYACVGVLACVCAAVVMCAYV